LKMTNYNENLVFGASEQIMQNAKTLRANLTPAEKLLWANLRDRNLGGYKFRRQHPIDRFIADFYCHEKRVVVELDGGIHLETDQMEYDENRTAALKRWDIEVIRFTNEEVFCKMSEVLNRIKEFGEREVPHSGLPMVIGKREKCR